jgi:hypothetical protein
MWVGTFALHDLYLPQSGYASVLFYGFNYDHIFLIAYTTLFIFILLSIAPVIYGFLKVAINTKFFKIAFSLSLLLGLASVYSKSNPMGINEQSKPDIVFIGLDSVSNIHLDHQPESLSFLKKHLDSGTRFSNSLTPLARTFPSWTSILSGKYPLNTGARFNLTPLENVNQNSELLPKILKKSGYRTIYAQDERKFNNMNESFGFDKVVGPRIGASEFILTNISDLPLVNLALLLPGSEYVFPSIVNNRADYIHYSPDRFISKLLDNIPEKDGKPLFLAVHLCLSHYPYQWNEFMGVSADDSFDHAHLNSIKGLERQIKLLIEGLKAKGRLENTLMVTLSDHGEAMDYEDGLWLHANKGDQLYSPHSSLKPPFPLTTELSGHGTRILARSQYETLLSIKGFGDFSNHLTSKTNDNLASLVDILPTVLSALNIDIPSDIDGMDLFSETRKNHTNRTIFTETGIEMSSMRTIDDIDENRLLKEAYGFYTINKESGLLTVKPERIKELINKKKYAIHTKDWMLALVRNPDLPSVSVLVHKPTGRWTLGKNRALIAEAPLPLLTKEIERQLGSEISEFVSIWPFDEHSVEKDS